MRPWPMCRLTGFLVTTTGKTPLNLEYSAKKQAISCADAFTSVHEAMQR